MRSTDTAERMLSPKTKESNRFAHSSYLHAGVVQNTKSHRVCTLHTAKFAVSNPKAVCFNTNDYWSLRRNNAQHCVI